MTRKFIDAIELLMIVGSTVFLLALCLCQPARAESHCGTERWPVKTLADDDHTKVAAQAKDVTVSELTAFAAPTRKELMGKPSNRYPQELLRYRVRAVLIGFKREDDQDFHIVIADPTDTKTTMVVEVPASACVDSSLLGKKLDAIRTAFVDREGTATAKFKHVKPETVTIEGVGFFDFIHGQTGVARNGFELHPVTSIVFASSQQLAARSSR